jgi:anaerobic selenocysteine-containing dehydrogenase
MPDELTIRTVCPRNCYCTCGMLVTVRGGKITRIEGDPLNPATGGKVCLKGISYAERAFSRDRLLHPLRRTPAGEFAEVSWNEALDDIAGRLIRLRSLAGPQSVLYYEGSGSHGALGILAEAFWRPFGGPTRAHGDLCWPAGLEATRLTYGDNRHNHPCHTRESRFILAWGHNPAETNIHQMRLILEAQEKGAVFAIIDPRSTDTTDAADIHLQPRPGTDAALALAMAHVIVEEGLHAAGWLQDHALGFEAYLERIREFTPERAAEISGVDASAIRELALSYARTRPALLIAGFGLQRNSHAGQTMRAVALLPALTGNIGIPGGGWQYANLASHKLRLPPLPDEPESPPRSFPVSRLGSALSELNNPPVRAAWFEKANPVSQHPRTGLVTEALKNLELLVVVDQFMTDTARLAHYVLPAKTMFEQPDLVTAYWHPYLQYRARIFDPPGEVKPETGIWRLLCERFGFNTRYFDGDPDAILRSMMPDGRDSEFDGLVHAPLDLSAEGDVAWKSGRFPTPGGKVEFYSQEAARLWGADPVPGYVPLDEGHGSQLAKKFPLQLLTCKTRDRIHSQFGNLNTIQTVARPRRLDIHPADAAARGIRPGDRARIWNSRGETRLEAHLDHGIRPGVVHIIEGRCVPEDPEVNRLTMDGITDMNFGATFYECLVEVEKA